MKHNGLKLKKYTRTAERREKNLSEFRDQKAPGAEAPGAETPAREVGRLKKAAGWTERRRRGRGRGRERDAEGEGRG